MARLVAVAFGQASMPLDQIRALRVCRHTLDVARKLDDFVWDLVHVQGFFASNLPRGECMKKMCEYLGEVFSTYFAFV